MANFYKIYLSIADVPEEEPVMTFAKDLLEMGYTIRGNCTSPPSYPPVNITWFLNGKKVTKTTCAKKTSSKPRRRHVFIITQKNMSMHKI